MLRENHEQSNADVEALAEEIVVDAAHLDAAMHGLLTKLRVFDAAGGWYRQGQRSCARWLSWRVGWAPGTARERVRVANALGRLHQIDEALRSGQLSYSKVRAITRVATPENEHVLLEQARLTTGYQLEQICRKYRTVRKQTEGTRPSDDLDRRSVRRRETADGMVTIVATLHPEEAAVVWTALDRIATERCRDIAASRETARAGGASAEAVQAPDARNDSGPPARTAGVSAETSHLPGELQESRMPTAVERVAGNGAGAARSCGHDDVVEACTLGAGVSCNELHEPAGVSAETRHAPAFDRADALVAMAEAVLRGDRPHRSPTELLVTIPLEALQADAAGDVTNIGCCRDGTPISPTVARRLACDAGVVAVVEDAGGNTLAVGRKQRTIAGALKRALLRRDQTCRYPGCQSRVFLEGHHIEHWADGGKTDLSNVVALCSFHHRFMHEYGFTIELGIDGTATAYDPGGHAVREVPARMQLAGLGWPTLVRRNAHLGITADTIEPWDGTPADYVELVDMLVRADRLDERSWTAAAA